MRVLDGKHVYSYEYDWSLNKRSWSRHDGVSRIRQTEAPRGQRCMQFPLLVVLNYIYSFDDTIFFLRNLDERMSIEQAGSRSQVVLYFVPEMRTHFLGDASSKVTYCVVQGI